MSSAARNTGDRLRVAFIVTDAANPWIAWFAEVGHDVTTVTLADLGQGGRSAQARRLREIVRAGGFDALVAIETSANLLTLAATRGQEGPVTVVTEHDVLSLGVRGASFARRAEVARARRWYRTADVVTSISHPIGAEMSAGFGIPASRSLVIPAPVLGTASARPRIARTAGTDAGVQLVVPASVLSASAAARAMDAVVDELAARDVPAEIVRLAPDAAWADEVGPRAVVVLPTGSEGLGAVLVEAAAHGIPSVGVSTALGVADAVIPGVTGELALSSAPHAIADAVIAAARLEVGDVDAWLDRFTASSSGALLERAILRARA